MNPKINMIGVIGSNKPQLENLSIAEELGKEIINNDYFLVNGGLGGIMEAVSKGARNSSNYKPGMILGIIPSYDKTTANKYIDIVIPSGMGFARNALVVATSDIIISLEGGSGTLSEIALGWQLRRPIIALTNTGGWSSKLAGSRIDYRGENEIFKADSVNMAIEIIKKLIDKT